VFHGKRIASPGGAGKEKYCSWTWMDNIMDAWDAWIVGMDGWMKRRLSQEFSGLSSH